MKKYIWTELGESKAKGAKVGQELNIEKLALNGIKKKDMIEWYINEALKRNYIEEVSV